MKWLLAGLLIWFAWTYLRPRPRRPLSEVARARTLLGVSADADADEIRRAHRRLVADAHPDRGGSVELTRRINAARHLLVGGRR